MTHPALHRNRGFVLLQAGQLCSDAGTALTTIAFPLLALAVTDSAALAGLVGFARVLPTALFALPAGLAADRRDRRRIMIAADAVRMLAIAALAVLLLLGHASIWVIAVAAAVEGAGAAYFHAAYPGALRSVVPPGQLPAAVATQTGRLAAVRLVGPALGGALFGVGRAIPFLVDALTYLLSTLSLLAMRTPFQQPRTVRHEPLRTRFTEGFRFLWNHPFLRTCALLLGLANFIAPAVTFSLVVIGTDQGLSAGMIGLLVTGIGAGLLLGSALSPLVRRLLPVRAVLLLELWSWLGCGAFVIWPSIWVLFAALLPTSVAIPSTSSVVHGYRMAMTPDRLLGRVESVRATISLLIAPLGPLLAGLLLETTSARLTIALLAASGLALALWGTLSPAIRTAPSLDQLDTLAAR